MRSATVMAFVGTASACRDADTIEDTFLTCAIVGPQSEAYELVDLMSPARVVRVSEVLGDDFVLLELEVDGSVVGITFDLAGWNVIAWEVDGSVVDPGAPIQLCDESYGNLIGGSTRSETNVGVWVVEHSWAKDGNAVHCTASHGGPPCQRYDVSVVDVPPGVLMPFPFVPGSVVSDGSTRIVQLDSPMGHFVSAAAAP